MGYMIEELSKGEQKNLSIVRLTRESTARRLDLLVIPVDQIAFAQLYFTGSQEFNVAFRKHALKRGYTINEHEMKLTGKVEGAKAVPLLKTEEDVFDFLNIEYRAPEQRTGAAVKERVAAAEELKKKSKWVEKLSKTTGKPYWYNRETKGSRWKKPKNLEGGTRRRSRGSRL
jgi:hypothetical protein